MKGNYVYDLHIHFVHWEATGVTWVSHLWPRFSQLLSFVRDTTMVTTGVDHSMLDRSLMILDNEHAQTEDKVAACTELEG